MSPVLAIGFCEINKNNGDYNDNDPDSWIVIFLFSHKVASQLISLVHAIEFCKRNKNKDDYNDHKYYY